MENDAENEWLYGGCSIRKDNEHGICVATNPSVSETRKGPAPVTPMVFYSATKNQRKENDV